LTGVNLGKDVEIFPNAAIIYGQDDDESKPLPGKKLNKPALIKIFKILPKEGETEVEKEAKLIRILQKRGG